MLQHTILPEVSIFLRHYPKIMKLGWKGILQSALSQWVGRRSVGEMSCLRQFSRHLSETCNS